MNTKPLVSVVIPTCGPPDMLTEAVESVLAQDYPALEVIIVDDNGEGSDRQRETEKIAGEYSSAPVPVRYLKHPVNRNGAVARNRGIVAAEGEYIALLDDDDCFYPHKLSAQMASLADLERAEKFSYTSFHVLSDGKLRNRVRIRNTEDIPLAILLKQSKIPSSSLLISRECWELTGGFDETFERHQDWEFVIRMAQVCPSAAVKDFCFTKSVTRRNTPGDPEVFRRQRRHYLDTMRRFISRYSEKTQKKIYAVHTGDIALEYLRKQEWKETKDMIKQSTYKVYCLHYMARRVLVHLWYQIKMGVNS